MARLYGEPLFALPHGTPETLSEALRAALSCEPSHRPHPEEFARLMTRVGTELTVGAARTYALPRPGSTIGIAARSSGNVKRLFPLGGRLTRLTACSETSVLTNPVSWSAKAGWLARTRSSL